MASEHPELALLVVLAPPELASLLVLASEHPELALLVVLVRPELASLLESASVRLA